MPIKLLSGVTRCLHLPLRTSSVTLVAIAFALTACNTSTPEPTETSIPVTNTPHPTSTQPAPSASATSQPTVTATAVAVATATAGATATPESLIIEVPQGDAATIDGIFSPGEWDAALTADLTPAGELMLMHDDGYLFLAMRSQRLGYGSICVIQDDVISILHASAALGVAVFEPDDDGWQRTRQFEWCCRSLTDHAERDAHFEREGWVASLGLMEPDEEMEYQIPLDEGTLTLAVVYGGGTRFGSALWWPRSLRDDCRRVVSLSGNPPERLNFSPEQWVTIIAVGD